MSCLESLRQEDGDRAGIHFVEVSCFLVKCVIELVIASQLIRLSKIEFRKPYVLVWHTDDTQK